MEDDLLTVARNILRHRNVKWDGIAPDGESRAMQPDVETGLLVSLA